MTTQYTPILKLALPVTGELSGTWGTVVNDNITSMVEQAVAGLSTINTWTASPGNAHTLTTADGTSSEARCAMLVLATGSGGSALTGAGEVICPAASKLYVVKNGTSFAVTVKTSAGTGVAIPAGDTAFVFCDGTNVNACVTTIVNGHISGNLTVDGNTTLGDATSDTITATARFNTDLLPSTDNARDLGSSGNSWRTLYCDTSVLTPLVTATNLQVTNIKANDGTAVAVLTDSTGATDFSKAFTLSATTQNISLGASQTTGTFVLGGTAATGAITLDASTKTHTLNVGSGATENALTKTINIGTGGVSGSTTTITIGSSDGTTTTFNGTVNVTTLDLTNLEVTNIKAKDGTAGMQLADSTGVVSFTANPILSGGTANGVAFLNASKVLTTGSALTFDGTTLVATATTGAATTYPAYFDNSGAGVGTGARIGFRNTAVSYGEIGYLYDGAFATIIDSAGSNNTRFLIAGTEQMRLTSTGLGIGTSSPNAKLAVVGGGIRVNGYSSNSAGDGVNIQLGTTGGVNYLQSLNGTSTNNLIIDGNQILFRTGVYSDSMTLDSSGNLGLGVTPSAWNSAYKAQQVNARAVVAGDSTQTVLANNWFVNSSGTNIYIASAAATAFSQDAGVFKWFTAPSGTAGNAISFTQSLTLDSTNLTLLSRSMNTIRWDDGTSAPSGTINASISSDASPAIIFSTRSGGSSPTERARITSGGYFKASDNGTYLASTGSYHELDSSDASNAAVVIRATNASFTGNGLQVRVARNTTDATFFAIRYYNEGAAADKFLVADSGNVTNTNNSYGAISDARKKTDIVDAGSQWSDIKALRFRKFKMKDDPSGLVQLGVVAQEVELTSPGLVDEHQDRDAEGNDLGTTTKSVKTSVLLMKAAVALQEAMARIETLEAEVAALKGA